MHLSTALLTLCLMLVPCVGRAGNNTPPMQLTLPQAIALAQANSADAQAARHTFRAAYWSYRNHRANYLPSLTLSSAPNLNRSINKVTQGDGTIRFVEQNLLTTDLTLSIRQNIALTGGYVFLNSDMQRIDQFSGNTHSWSTMPVAFGLSQPIFGYNSMKWDRRIKPLSYREAQRAFVETMELVAEQAVQKFFNLASAQNSYEMACTNYAHADTLARFGRGRYEIGSIPESEMLQLELNKLSESTSCMDASISVDECMQDLRSYLGIKKDCAIRVVMSDSLPHITVDVSEALRQATLNSPDILAMERRKLDARSQVAQAKANAGLKADLYLRLGLTQTSERLSDAYRQPLDQQYVSLSVSLPILDWGQGRGQVRVARSNCDLVDTQVAQSQIDFDQNVSKLVTQFNMQLQRVYIAAQSDQMASRRNDVARGLYLLGKNTILDLNAAISAKDQARSHYISSLCSYWSLYYSLRSLTLYDFERREPLATGYEELIANER